jgi:aminopeptidase YwaD
MPIRVIVAGLMAVTALQPGVRDSRPGGTLAAAPIVTAGSASAARVEQKRLMATIAELPTKRSARSDKEHLDGLYKTQELLVKRLKELGYKPELNEVDYLGSEHDASRPLYSVIVEIAGRAKIEAGKPRDVVIVGAHFDAVPAAPGADDNGSGVAALLEIARVLKDEPMERTLRLCFFNLEEQGMVGSSKYALEVGDRIREKKEKITLMVSLDMLGYYRTEKGSQKTFIPEATGFKSPKEGDFIAVVTTLKHRPVCQEFTKQMRLACPEAKVVSVDFLPALTELLRSDHAPFLGMGIPAMLVTDTAEYRSPHYHKPTDAVETIDAERFTLTVRALVGALEEAAGVVGVAKTR